MTVQCFSCGSIERAFQAIKIEDWRQHRSIRLCRHCQDELFEKMQYRDTTIKYWSPRQ